LWKDAAEDALQRQTTNEGMRKAFGAVVVHGLALRWVAFLTSSAPEWRWGIKCPAVCVGKGAYFFNTLCWFEFDEEALVREPCKHVAADTFPPRDNIAPSTYSLVPGSSNAVIEGVGCVAVRVPIFCRTSLPVGREFPITAADHMYFTVQMMPLDAVNARAYAADFERLVRKMPGDDVPCLHLFFTPQQYTPDPSVVEALLTMLRSLSHQHFVACVNVQNCMTPSPAWTLACAGFATPPGFNKSQS
jgi:hypothetical protein